MPRYVPISTVLSSWCRVRQFDHREPLSTPEGLQLIQQDSGPGEPFPHPAFSLRQVRV